ncbi:AMP-dependent synthetase/ligase [Piscinibacter sp.]|uniref:AMP-dependent synthetase/ligase n=1 Tax=Piscinibacter sp. TaxID=1903157 RepID=UPI0039E44647
MNTSSLVGELAALATLPQLFAWRIARSPEGQAYRWHDEAAGGWISLNWAQAGQRIDGWRRALAAFGLRHGERVAILLPNGIAAVCIDQAALAAGGVPVPLHAIDNAGSIAYILADCEAALLVLADAAQWQRIRAVGVALPALRGVVVADDAGLPPPEAGDPPLQRLADWLAAGRDAALPVQGPRADDLAAIVYTSGTTGKPKGVMLTHANVMANLRAIVERVGPREDDVFLSFLPLSHTFERTGGYYLPIAAGSCVAYARSVASIADDLLTVRPTVLISVPRIYERVFAKLQEQLAASPLKQRLFAAAQGVGWRRFCRAQGLADDALAGDGAAQRALDALAWPLLERLVARPLLARFGGRLRIAVSGGAPLSTPIAHCFLGLGLPLLQGYGMTETSPVVSVNAPHDNDPASVGRALAGVEVRIAENRELQVRGPSVMKGYWKRPEDTTLALEADGWLHTGDQAEIVDGRIRIRGRIKEIIVTSTGEKLPPADLELAICADPLFEQAFVVGENRPFVACIAVVGAAAWARLAASLGLDADDPAALNAPAAQRAALERIEAATRSFPRYAVPRALWLTREPWTIENTLLTPTLKLKRLNLMKRFGEEIEALYRRSAPPR